VLSNIVEQKVLDRRDERKILGFVGSLCLIADSRMTCIVGHTNHHSIYSPPSYPKLTTIIYAREKLHEAYRDQKKVGKRDQGAIPMGAASHRGRGRIRLDLSLFIWLPS
jgi:hypothetical protein